MIKLIKRFLKFIGFRFCEVCDGFAHLQPHFTSTECMFCSKSCYLHYIDTNGYVYGHFLHPIEFIYYISDGDFNAIKSGDDCFYELAISSTTRESISSNAYLTFCNTKTDEEYTMFIDAYKQYNPGTITLMLRQLHLDDLNPVESAPNISFLNNRV